MMSFLQELVIWEKKKSLSYTLFLKEILKIVDFLYYPFLWVGPDFCGDD